MYADDTILLGSSVKDLNELLILPELYCDLNGLHISVKITKIMIFRKAGKLKAVELNRFYCKESNLGVLSTFIYLGTLISMLMLSQKSVNFAIKKAKMAIGATLTIESLAKNISWSSNVKLLNLMVTSIHFYAFPMWGLAYVEKIETS